MNILLWTLQVLVALHTIMGAVWKFSHTAEQTMPSLKAIPSGVWLVLAGFELLCALCLVIPAFYKPLNILVPSAAICIAAIMLCFCAIHFMSGNTNLGSPFYWLVVTTLCGFIAYGRLVLRPF
jgi:hypothetical protein